MSDETLWDDTVHDEAAFLAGRRSKSSRAYAKDLADLAAYLGLKDAAPAVDALVAGTAGRAYRRSLGLTCFKVRFVR